MDGKDKDWREDARLIFPESFPEKVEWVNWQRNAELIFPDLSPNEAVALRTSEEREG